jgi:hypothetical protein
MIYNLPPTLTRVGRYDTPLERAVKEFSEPLEPITFGLGNTRKYCTFQKTEPPYLLIVSRQIEGEVTAAGYNVMLTVTSRSDLRNSEIADQFEKETGIKLNLAVPSQINTQNQTIGLAFLAFEKNPLGAMTFLKRRENRR